MGVGGQRQAPVGTRHGTHLQEAGWASVPAWTGAENLASAGIRSHSESLSRKEDTQSEGRNVLKHN